MLITTQIVSELNPCEDRFNNFTKEYTNYSGTLRDFLKLENITYNDKVWVFTRLLDKDTLVKWSIECAESVKHIYDKQKNDGKLDIVFEKLRSIKDFNNMSQEDLDAARVAEGAARAISVTWAAEAAWEAAALAAEVAWGTAALAATKAVWVAAVASKKQQEQLNLDLLVKVLDEKGL